HQLLRRGLLAGDGREREREPVARLPSGGRRPPRTAELGDPRRRPPVEGGGHRRRGGPVPAVGHRPGDQERTPWALRRRLPRWRQQWWRWWRPAAGAPQEPGAGRPSGRFWLRIRRGAFLDGTQQLPRRDVPPS